MKYLIGILSFFCLHAATIELASDVTPHIPHLAELRMEVFREYPYLYDGELEYEMAYLSQYQEAERSFFVLAKEGDRVIGAISGIPVEESFDGCKDAFETRGLDSSKTLYLGEIVLQKSYRMNHIGTELYRAFENFAREAGYTSIAACMVVKEKSTFVDVAAAHRGFKKIEGFVGEYEWKEVGAEESTMHPMQFWIKEL
ncbi:MAG: GNAT family N-acetyltransferase [Simkaniaceae bacterium]|nr:GNAT family N-acetyltransferase [Simkaniaceae bacterium]